MKTDLPRPVDVLEELAEKVLGQIDRLSPASFNSALDEMIEYHQFLLEAYGTETPDGVSFSYAEISDWIESPHHNWLRQYRRLFERAASSIDQDPDFIAILARVPMRLLQELAPNSSIAITDGILDLGITLIGRLENWLTLRSLQGDARSVSGVRLHGSDKSVYKDVIIDAVGSWERLVQFVPSMYSFSDLKKLDPTQQWVGLVKSFSFFRQHLRNTAYFVASATWNEDGIGSLYFQDTLARWIETFSYALPDDDYLIRNQVFLLPSLTDADWKNATKKIQLIENDSSTPIDPPSIFKILLVGMHEDVTLITTAVLLRWHIEGKQNSETSLDIASRIFNQKTIDVIDDRIKKSHDFMSLFARVIRIEVAEPRYGTDTYGGTLDSIAAFLDQMTERDVVAGRIFSPSTIHRRDELQLSFLALLLARLGQNTNEALFKRIETITSNEDLFPRGDRTLADLVGFFDRMSETLLRNQSGIRSTVIYLASDINFENAVSRLDQILKHASTVIQSQRTERIKSRPVDPPAIERIRKRAEERILNRPLNVRIFQEFRVVRELSATEYFRELRINKLPKGMFTTPAMVWNWHDLDETILRRIDDWRGNLVETEFRNRKRSISRTLHEFGSWRFWKLARHLARQVGSRPSLLLSSSDQARKVLNWTNKVAANPSLRIATVPRGERTAGYLATIEGIEVYAGNSDSGPLIFSAHALNSVVYHAVNEKRQLVSFRDEPDEDPWHFSITARVSEEIRWDDSRIFEIKFKKAPESDG